MVLHKLYASGEVSLVELIRDIPSKGSIFTSLLHGGVEECYSIQYRPPLWQAGVV